MHIFNVNVQTKDFAPDAKVPEFYAKQLTSLALKFTNEDGTPYALSVDDMIYFVADTDFNPNTAPAIPKTYAAPADIYPDDGLVVFSLNTNTPRYRSAIQCKGTCLNAEVRIQRGTSWEPLLFSRVLGNPMVVDPDAPPEPAPLIEWVQTVNGLVGHVDILDADGVPYPVDTTTNSITIIGGGGGQDYIPGTGIDITDATVSVTSDVAFKSDITSSVQAHNESITSHADIRTQLSAKADTVDVIYALDSKVDKDGDKQLSDNNFSDADKNKVDSLGSMATETASDYRKKTDQDAIDNGKLDKNQPITAATSTKVTYDSNGLILSGTSLAEADIPEISQSKVTGLVLSLSGKVDKIEGKGLSTEDYTTAEKSKLAGLENYDDTPIRAELDEKADSSAVTAALDGKVDKVEGKGLSTNDYSNDDKSKVDALGSMSAEDAADYRTAADQDLIDAGKVNSNAAITGATKAKITYDSKGLVTAGADLEESDIPNIPASKVTGLGTMAAENAADYRTAAEQDLIDSTSAYGVIYNPNVSAPNCQKVIMTNGTIVSVADFATLPAHDFKRCVMSNLADREIAYYLDPEDSTKKFNGNCNGITSDGSASDLTGADGDVMVEIPVTYWRCETIGEGKILYLVNDKAFEGASIHPFFYVSPGGATARKQYVGAYQSTICDASGARIANMMNESATASSAFATGYKARSVAGCKPWTNMPQSTHRTAAANNGGGYGVNSLFHQYLYLMMMIEGGSMDTQSAISPGFAYASAWNYAFTRLSGRANFGNGTGSILADAVQDSAITWQSVAADQKVVQFSYRGIENPYGEIWKFEDGIVKTQAQYYWTKDCSIYSDSTYANNYALVNHAWPQSTGYVTKWNPQTFFPLTLGGASTTYMCDYCYNDSAAGSRVVLRGGDAHYGAADGAGGVYVYGGLANTYSSVGGRLAA